MPSCKRASPSGRVDHFRTSILSVNTCVCACVHTWLFTCMNIHRGTHSRGVCIFPPSPLPLQHWLTCSFIQPSANSDTMVTAAEILFPRETDNIEITTPFTTQPSPLSPYIPYCTHPQVCSVWHSLLCKGKLLELAAFPTAWQVCALCPEPALVFLLE